jgi:hypothetical protein
MLSLLVAILSLAPHLPEGQADTIARHISAETKRHDIDPLLVVAIAKIETGFNPMAVSPTRDYGLLQVHVSKTTNADLLGAELALLHIPTNIRRSIAMLVFWRSYHLRRCKARRHLWWSHYKWGRVVRGHDWARRIELLRNRLRRSGNT